MEGRTRFDRGAGQVGADYFGNVLAHLNGRRGKSGNGLAADAIFGVGRISEHVYVAMIGNREVGIDDDTPGAIQWDAHGGQQLGRGHAGGPDDILRGQMLAADPDTAFVNVGHAGMQAHLDAHGLQIALGALAEGRIELRQQTGITLEENNAAGGGVDMAKILLNVLGGDFAKSTGHFHAGRTPSDDYERKLSAA